MHCRAYCDLIAIALNFILKVNHSVMIRELTPIRFALCMMIFAHHAYSYAAGGAPAVAAFFMLSGFCMTLGYKDKILSGSVNYIGYLKTRFAKFYPIHWITLLVFFLITFCAGDVVINKRIMLSNVLLLQSWIPDWSFYFSYNSIAWYLSTALFAYICFPMVINLLGKLMRRQRMYLLIAMLMCYGVVAYSMPKSAYHAMLYINPVCRCIDFVIGIYLAEWYKSIEIEKLRTHRWLFDLGMIASFVLLNIVSMRLADDIRLISAFFWLPSAILILSTSIVSRTSSYLGRILASNGVQKLTLCSFSLMMWSKCAVRLFKELDVANSLWGGQFYSSLHIRSHKLVII